MGKTIKKKANLRKNTHYGYRIGYIYISEKEIKKLIGEFTDSDLPVKVDVKITKSCGLKTEVKAE